ncbi:neutral zinc metallopeptidase [Thiopseudomonas alkaliphila]|uniref:neutral zinc metallopeptidase n=1 Tax=Thiopseudomonas alkaliphila TaxID=1697053 RepID=UPI0025781F12|nr:neutral zinc metallopeptidase [Thiopseudomonas alkaliphila]MDM1708962.1 neutral zinc metallopeptidase [Thiopseudomonas alkaliphila]
MRWNKGRRSPNVVDNRGRTTVGGKGLTLGGIAIVVVLGLMSGQDPLQILGSLAGQVLQQGGVSSNSTPSPPSATQSQEVQFVESILGDTEDTWQALFQQLGKTGSSHLRV